MVLEEEVKEETEEESERGGNESSLKMGRKKFSKVLDSSSGGLQLRRLGQLASSVGHRGSPGNTIFSPLIEARCRNTGLLLPC